MRLIWRPGRGRSAIEAEPAKGSVWIGAPPRGVVARPRHGAVGSHTRAGYAALGISAGSPARSTIGNARLKVDAEAGAFRRPARARALAVDADELSAARLLAEAAVVLVAGQVDTGVHTLGEPCGAALGAASLVAHLSVPARRAAGSAVAGVALEIDAGRRAAPTAASSSTPAEATALRARGVARGATAAAGGAARSRGTRVTAATAIAGVRVRVHASFLAGRLACRARRGRPAGPAAAGLSARASVAARAAVPLTGLEIHAGISAERRPRATRARARGAVRSGRAGGPATPAVRRVGRCVDARIAAVLEA